MLFLVCNNKCTPPTDNLPILSAPRGVPVHELLESLEAFCPYFATVKGGKGGKVGKNYASTFS